MKRNCSNGGSWVYTHWCENAKREILDQGETGRWPRGYPSNHGVLVLEVVGHAGEDLCLPLPRNKPPALGAAKGFRWLAGIPESGTAATVLGSFPVASKGGEATGSGDPMIRGIGAFVPSTAILGSLGMRCFTTKGGNPMTKRLLFLVTALFTLGYCQAPAPVPKRAAPANKVVTTPPEAQPAAREMSMDQVIGFIKAKVSEDIIIAQIRKRGAFDPTPDQIVQLKQAGASDNIIRAMMDPQAQPVAAPAAPPAAVPSPQATIVNPTPAPTASPVVAGTETQQAATPFPDEQGVYWFKEGKELVRMEGVGVSNIRTGSTLVSGLTGGIKAARINAQLKGARSEFRMKERQPRFYFYLTENVNVGDFLLLRLAQRLDVRQIELGQQTFWKKQVGIDHTKTVEFSYKRIKNRLYLVTPNHELEPGEYGFYTSAGVSVVELRKESARIYDFGIDP